MKPRTPAERWCLINGWHDPDTGRPSFTQEEASAGAGYAHMSRYSDEQHANEEAGLKLWAKRFRAGLNPATGERP